jgi:hypothetical protein
MGEGCRPPVAGAGHPLTDSPFADAERFGHAVLGPAFLLEMPGVQPSSCFPMSR